MKRITLLIFLIAISLIAYSQTDSTYFEEEFRSSFRHAPKLDFKFDSRFAFFNNSSLKTTGIKIGLNFNKKIKLGIGYNGLLVPFVNRTVDDSIRLRRRLNYRYISHWIEYVYFNSRRWEMCLSAQLGIGGARYLITDESSTFERRTPIFFMLSYEPALFVDYKFIKYAAIGTGTGFRLMLYKHPRIKEDLNSFVYVLKLKVYLGEIWRDIRPNKS